MSTGHAPRTEPLELTVYVPCSLKTSLLYDSKRSLESFSQVGYSSFRLSFNVRSLCVPSARETESTWYRLELPGTPSHGTTCSKAIREPSGDHRGCEPNVGSPPWRKESS